jgi:hypothetical protein
MSLHRGVHKLVRSPLVLVGLLLVTLWIALGRSVQSEIAPEEQLAVQRAEQIVDGEPSVLAPARRPGVAHDHLVAAAIVLTEGWLEPLTAGRILHAGLFLLILLAVFALGAEVFDLRTGLSATVLLSTSALFVDEVLRIRPEVPQALLGLIAIWAFLRHGRDQRARHLVLGSLAAGLGFLFVDRALLLVLALGLAAILRVAFGRMSWRELGLAVAGLALILPVVGWRIDASSWVASLEAAAATLAWPEAGPVAWLAENFRHGILLWALFGVGLLLYLERGRELELGVIVLSVLAAAWVLRRPHDAVLVLPLVAIVAGRGLVRAFDDRPHLATALLIAGAVPGLYHLTGAPRASEPAEPVELAAPTVAAPVGREVALVLHPDRPSGGER